MKPWIAVAVALTILVAAAHSWLGELYIIRPLLKRKDLPRLLGGDTFTRGTLRFAWHLTSLAWLGLAAVLVALAPHAPLPAVRSAGAAVALTFAASAALALAGSRARHLSWLVFAIVAIAAWLGTRP